jgi:hypothetical protein
MCYSIYLLHYPLIPFLGRVTTRLGVESASADLLVQLALIVPPALAASAVYVALVERQCMDPAWPSRLRAWLTARVRPRVEAATEPVALVYSAVQQTIKGPATHKAPSLLRRCQRLTIFVMGLRLMVLINLLEVR